MVLSGKHILPSRHLVYGGMEGPYNIHLAVKTLVDEVGGDVAELVEVPGTVVENRHSAVGIIYLPLCSYTARLGVIRRASLGNMGSCNCMVN